MNKTMTVMWLVLCLGCSTIAMAGGSSTRLVDEIMYGGDIGKVEAIIDNGADISTVDGSWGITPLMAAAFRGKRDIVKLLLDKGADSSTTINLLGVAPLVSALNRFGDRNYIVDTLRSRGVDIRGLAGEGAEFLITAFDCAVLGNHRDIAVLLPPYGPNGKVLFGAALDQRVAALSKASKDYLVGKNVADINAVLDVIRTATTMFYQERGGFPGKQGSMYDHQYGQQVTAGSVWEMMGLSKYLNFPSTVVSVHYVPIRVGETGTADSYVLILQLDHIRPGASDGLLFGMSPSTDIVISSPATATASPFKLASGRWVYHYGCKKLSDQPVDARILKAFATFTAEMLCN